MVKEVKEMYKIYMIIAIETGEIKGFYTSDIWELENIEAEVKESQVLKEISVDLWNILLGNNEKIKMSNPVVKYDNISLFLDEDTLKWENLNEKITQYFEEKEIEQEPYELTQSEKDIKVLAEAIKSVIEPMAITEVNYSNSILERLQEIIDRYIID